MRRRRACPGCGRRFTTFERREPDPVHVLKRGGERQRFDRMKLRAALLNAAHKRPVAAAEIESIVDRIELTASDSGGELSSERIGELCLSELRQLDRGAYLQFAGTLPSVPALPEAAAALAAEVGSVRGARKDAESTRKSASRRE
jgi:transcriptional repressor NrdR